MSITSEYTLVCFSYNGVKHHETCTCEGAAGFAAGIIASANKTTALFTDIVVARTIITRRSSVELNHALGLAKADGPMDPQNFLRMMRYPSGISINDWIKHCKSVEQITQKEPKQQVTNDSKQSAEQDSDQPPPYS